jgi:hypothetical protein
MEKMEWNNLIKEISKVCTYSFEGIHDEVVGIGVLSTGELAKMKWVSSKEIAGV